MHTQAAVLFELGGPLRIIDLEIPPLQPGQVLVDVVYSGVCHTQLLEVHGKRGPDRFLPHTLGHEGSGTVRAVGEGVTKLKPGDRVVLSWIKGSGSEVRSTEYKSSAGPINSGPISTFMRSTVTCESRVTPLASEIPLRKASLLGCAVATGVGCIRNTGRVQAGSAVAVFGVGGIGSCALQGARIAGAKWIIAVDIHEHKLAQARKLGATHTVNASNEDPVNRILDITNGKGADYAIEAAGLPVTMEQAYDSVRRDGGMAILAGNLSSGSKICIDPFPLICGRRIIGTWGGDTVPERDFPLYEELYRNGQLNLNDLGSHTFRLSEINDALRALEQGDVTRAIIEL